MASSLSQPLLLTPKILFLTINLSFYTLHQYRGNFITQYFTFSKQEYGTMIGTLLFITFFTNIIIATLNDKYNHQKSFLIGALCLCIVFFQLFFVTSYINIKHMFWVNMLFYLLFSTSVPPVLDKIMLEYLNRMGSMTYGRQRLYGTIGYLLTNWIHEMTITTKDKSGVKIYDYGKLKYYQVITTVVAIVLSALLIKGSKSTKKRSNIMASWKLLMRNGSFLFLMLIIFLNGLTRAAMTLYLTIFFTTVVKVKGYTVPGTVPSLLGFFITIFNDNPLSTIAMFSVLFEIVIMFYSQTITSRYGLYKPLIVGQIFQLARFVGYCFLDPKWKHVFPIICVFELLKGVNYALTHTCAVQIVTNSCPPHLKTTAQMIYSGTFTGLATAVGGALFGYVLKTKEGAMYEEMLGEFRTFFWVNLGISVVCVVLCVVKYGYCDNELGVRAPVEKVHSKK